MDARHLRIIRSRAGQPTRPYAETQKKIEKLDKEAIKRTMLAVLRKRGPLSIDDLFRATTIGLGLKMRHLYTVAWVSHEELIECMYALLYLEGKLQLTSDLKLSLIR